MSKLNLEQIKADRAAGTQGPWTVDVSLVPYQFQSGKTGNHTQYRIKTAYSHPQLKAPAPVVTTSVGVGIGGVAAHLIWMKKEDADRISRVPDLEAALIEAVELLRLLDRVAGVPKKSIREFLGRFDG